jgi:hypothetical protein
MKALYPIVGPVFFMSFIFVGVFVLLNMFLAIINESYANVKEDMSHETPGIYFFKF